jgi:hypothetical protein
MTNTILYIIGFSCSSQIPGLRIRIGESMTFLPIWTRREYMVQMNLKIHCIISRPLLPSILKSRCCWFFKSTPLQAQASVVNIVFVLVKDFMGWESRCNCRWKFFFSSEEIRNSSKWSRACILRGNEFWGSFFLLRIHRESGFYKWGC